MCFSSKVVEFGWCPGRFTADFGRGFAATQNVNAFLVLVMAELSEISLNIHCIPDKIVIKKFSALGSY